MWSTTRASSSVGASSSNSNSNSNSNSSSNSGGRSSRSCRQGVTRGLVAGAGRGSTLAMAASAMVKKAAPMSSLCPIAFSPSCTASGRQRQRHSTLPALHAWSSSPATTTAAAAAAAAAGPSPPEGGAPPMQGYSSSEKDAWRKEYDQEEDNDYLSLSEEEVQQRLLEATALIAVVLDLRPISRNAFNSSLEVWQHIRRVPPWRRHQLLEDLEPGAIRALWKASMERYVLDDVRAMDLAQGYSIWQDFPEASGQVYTYDGKCEQFTLSQHVYRLFEDRPEQKRPQPQEKPWVRASQSSLPIQTDSFKMLFFVQPQSGQLFARVVFPWLGPVDRWWLSCYLKMKMELALTPIPADAGADITFEYPYPGTDDMNGWLSEEMLLREQLPLSTWPSPEPADGCGSPFSVSARDYVRAAGPGVYVGAAYRTEQPGLYVEDDCVYFVIARRMSKEDYVRQLSDAGAM